MKQLLLILLVGLLPGCAGRDADRRDSPLRGAWLLMQVDYPMGSRNTYPGHGKTYLRIYEGDSVMCQCVMVKSESELIIQPDLWRNVTLIDKGGGEWSYMEADHPRPLTVQDDSTIVIQQNGVLYTWYRADSIAQEWGEEICDIIETDLQGGDAETYRSYVLSSKERRQESLIHVFIYSTIAFVILVFVITLIAVSNRKAKQRLQLQLQQIREEHEERPQAVRQAIETLESQYFASEEYQALQHRMAMGQRIHDEEWSDIEAQLKMVYPGFASQLRTLYPMSALEYQTCLLIKLCIAPSDIANVLARDVSTISTVRSRLYKKVFGRKGSTKEWDEFILSIGA